tara:strand:- start:10600 stop:10752 length:153 start_codon:yes stop_codon:yes gene_type:complete
VVEIHNQQASAVISLQGAQVLSWIPKGEAEVIWLSAELVLLALVWPACGE